MGFQEIIGHERELGILKGLITSGRVPHAFLFAGPDGVGKKLVARAFAAALNCESPGGNSCGLCRDCAAIEGGSHPNVMEIWPLDKPVDKKGERDPLGLIRIDQIREVQSVLRYRAERGTKVVIVNGADRFMPAAANAFLKTLEEPPGGSVIVLVSSRPADLLPTVVSRCRRINFRPLSEGAVRAYLIEKKGIAPAEAGAVARLSDGSISKAAGYIDEGWLQKRRDVVERLLSFGQNDADEALKFAEELSKRDDLEETLDFLKSWYRDRIVAFEGAPHLIANTDMQRRMKDDRVEDFNRLSSSFWAVEEALRNITPPRNGNRHLTMEALVLKLSGALLM